MVSATVTAVFTPLARITWSRTDRPSCVVAERSAPRTRKESFGTEKRLICDDAGSRTARITFARDALLVSDCAFSKPLAAAISSIVCGAERKGIIAAAGKVALADALGAGAELAFLEAAIALLVTSAHTNTPVRNVKILFILTPTTCCEVLGLPGVRLLRTSIDAIELSWVVTSLT